jgi:small-conductance mechanosensitive channel
MFVAPDGQNLETLDDAVESLSLLDAGLAMAVIVAFWLLAIVVDRIVKRVVAWIPRTPQWVAPFAGRVARFMTSLAGLALALPVLGVDIKWITLALVAAGLILVLMARPLVENTASGLLLNTRPLFSIGDDVETNGFRGQVLEVNARSTVIRTSDWRRVHIPNGDVLDNPIVVYSALDRRRSQVDLEVDYWADMDEVSRLLVKAALSVEGVLSEPSPEVTAQGFGNGTVVLALQWWHDPQLLWSRRTRDGVILEAKRALDGAGITMPAPGLVLRQPALQDRGRTRHVGAAASSNGI